MFIEKYYNVSEQRINYSREQASDFAKIVADDFNPLHDIEAKRFCVPGDLLFSTVLAQAGVSKQMSFYFSGMVTDGINLAFPKVVEHEAQITDEAGKEYLRIEANGETSHKAELVESLIRAYVGFSGHTFPHILVELMAKQNVMINPKRPMVMYESMSICFDTFDVDEVALTFSHASLDVQDKRGNVSLEFNFTAQGKVVGKGVKRMVLSGLRPYEKAVMDDVVAEYNQWKQDFSAAS